MAGFGGSTGVSKEYVDRAIAQSTAKIAWSVTTIAQLESAIVTLGSTLTDRGSMVGCTYTNFADATLGFNGSLCECTIQRNANGVYLATFITTASDVITDYYYSNAHHWYSSKQSTAIPFSYQSTPGTNPFNEGGTGAVLAIKAPNGTAIGYLVIRPQNYVDSSSRPIAMELYKPDWSSTVWRVYRD